MGAVCVLEPAAISVCWNLRGGEGGLVSSYPLHFRKQAHLALQEVRKTRKLFLSC